MALQLPRELREGLARKDGELGHPRQLVDGRSLVSQVGSILWQRRPSSRTGATARVARPLEHAEGSVLCPSCGLAEYANPAPTVSALVRDEQGRILLARRAVEPGAGLWDLIGGFMDEGEEPLETLRRELSRRRASRSSRASFLRRSPDTYGPDGNATINFYWEARLPEGEPRAADDVAELAWFPRDALPPRGEFAFANTVELLEKSELS